MKFNSLVAGAILSGLVAGSVARAQDAAKKEETKPAAPAKAEKKHCKDKKHCDEKMMKGKKGCNGCDAAHKKDAAPKAEEHKEEAPKN